MTFAMFFFWITLSVAVGVFAYERRNRNGFVWFFAALIFSPLVAGIFCAIAHPLPDRIALPSVDESKLPPLSLATLVLLLVAVAVAAALITGVL
jgi:hypothetical protein